MFNVHTASLCHLPSGLQLGVCIVHRWDARRSTVGKGQLPSARVGKGKLLDLPSPAHGLAFAPHVIPASIFKGNFIEK